MRHLTMVSRTIVSKTNETVGATFVDQDRKFVNLDMTGIRQASCDKDIEFVNIAVTNRGIEGTNGKLDRYTTFDIVKGGLVGNVHPVVLDKIVNEDGQVIAFTVFNLNGYVEVVSAKDAVAIGKRAEFANAKIVNRNGEDIVSAIAGNFTTTEVSTVNNEKKLTFNELINGSTADVLLVSKACNSAMKKMSETYVCMVFKCADSRAFKTVMDMVTASNSKLRKNVEAVAKMSVSSLEIQRIDSNRVYAIVDIDTAFKLLSHKGVTTKFPKELTVSYVEYKTGVADEHLVKVTNGWTINGTDKIAVKVAKSLQDKLGNIGRWA